MNPVLLSSATLRPPPESPPTLPAPQVVLGALTLKAPDGTWHSVVITGLTPELNLLVIDTPVGNPGWRSYVVLASNGFPLENSYRVGIVNSEEGYGIAELTLTTEPPDYSELLLESIDDLNVYEVTAIPDPEGAKLTIFETPL